LGANRIENCWKEGRDTMHRLEFQSKRACGHKRKIHDKRPMIASGCKRLRPKQREAVGESEEKKQSERVEKKEAPDHYTRRRCPEKRSFKGR